MAWTVIDNVASASELWAAAQIGDVAQLQSLLADPAYKEMINNNTNAQGHSALFFACYGGANAETVRILLKAGADPFQRDNHGNLPLHYAANALDPTIIAALLEAPGMYASKLAVATSSGQTPLHAIFMPGADGVAKNTKTAEISSCIPYLLKRDESPLVTLRAADKNGLSTLTLVKYYGLQASFHPFVPPKTFETLLKSIAVPGNIEALLQADLYPRIVENEPAPTMSNNVRRMRR